jgi:hypothetical protein
VRRPRSPMGRDARASGRLQRERVPRSAPVPSQCSEPMFLANGDARIDALRQGFGMPGGLRHRRAPKCMPR